MLKIKDNVDLKELEKFEFKPRYSSDTGKLLHYYRDYFTDCISFDCYTHYKIIISNEKIKIERGGFLKKKSIKTNFIYDKPPIYNKGFDIFVDLLFDLIQAGLVEKID